MAYAAEAEFGTTFLKGQGSVPIRKALEETKWPQPPTTVQVDNYTETGIANKKSSKNVKGI